MIETARAALAAQAFSVLLGTEVTSYAPGSVELRLPITDRIKQQFGFVHGGVLSYLADNAITFACGSALGPQVVTSEYKINYLRPAIGTMLVARARLVHAGKTLAVSECGVFAVDAEGNERLCATALGSATKVSSAGPG